MRNWPMFKAAKKPIVIDFFGWMEDPFEKAIKERAETGWVKVWWTKPELNIPREPNPLPFKLSTLNNAINDILLGRPTFVRPYYQEVSINLSDYLLNNKPSLRTVMKLWEQYNA